VADPQLAGSIREVMIRLRIGRVGGRRIDDLDGEAVRVRRPEHPRRTARLRVLVAGPLGAGAGRIDSFLQSIEVAAAPFGRDDVVGSALREDQRRTVVVDDGFELAGPGRAEGSSSSPYIVSMNRRHASRRWTSNRP